MENRSSTRYDAVLNASQRNAQTAAAAGADVELEAPDRIPIRPGPEPKTTVRYRECQRNHAARTGNRILDGCGEFMPSGEQGTPESMRCAACDCHRNFHRKEINGGGATFYPQLATYQQQILHAPTRGTQMVAFGGGAHAEYSTSSDRDGGEASRKRLRTKFAPDQKEKMMEFAEKIGWRYIQRKNEEEDQIDKFCEEIEVTRQVFKVWVHNNKQAIKRKSQSQL